MKMSTGKRTGLITRIVLSMCLSAAFCSVAIGDLTWTITQLTTTGDNYAPDISGTNVVWFGADGYIHSNFGWQSPTLATNFPAISGTNVVWAGSDGYVQSNFGWQSDTRVSIYDGHPVISGTNVVWNAEDGYLHSNFGWQVEHPTWNSDFDLSGTNVVWRDWDPDNPTYFAILSNFGFKVPYGGDGLAISGRNVVWMGFDGSDYEIYSSFAGQLTDNSVLDRIADVSGTNVVWSSNDDHEIWTNFGGLVTSGPDVAWPAISGTTIVWQGYDGSRRDIYMATYGEAQVVPLPAGILLGLLGLGAAGLKLRKNV